MREGRMSNFHLLTPIYTDSTCLIYAHEWKVCILHTSFFPSFQEGFEHLPSECDAQAVCQSEHLNVFASLPIGTP